jgi:hypothetical protein
LDETTYLEEVEKTLVKEKYSRIGKVEKDGKVISEECESVEDKNNSEWLDRKAELIYDMEEQTIDFGKSKPTNWKGNKRVNLPKGGSSTLEAFLEVRRREAMKTFEKCKNLLGTDEDAKNTFDNLTAEEKKGLKSLQKRVKAKEIVICQTDKTGRFSILTAEQYLAAGKKHTEKDLEVENEDAEEIQRILNGNMRWLAKAVNLSIDWNQEDRALKNLLNHGLAVCPMTLLIKDHKVWTLLRMPHHQDL